MDELFGSLKSGNYSVRSPRHRGGNSSLQRRRKEEGGGTSLIRIYGWVCPKLRRRRGGKIDPYPTLVLLQPSLFLSATFSKIRGNYRVGNYFHPWDMPIEHLKLATLLLRASPVLWKKRRTKNVFSYTKTVHPLLPSSSAYNDRNLLSHILLMR